MSNREKGLKPYWILYYYIGSRVMMRTKKLMKWRFEILIQGNGTNKSSMSNDGLKLWALLNELCRYITILKISGLETLI